MTGKGVVPAPARTLWKTRFWPRPSKPCTAKATRPSQPAKHFASIRAVKRLETIAARKSRCGKRRSCAPPPSGTAAPGVPRGIRQEPSAPLRLVPPEPRGNAPGKPQFPAGFTRENHPGWDIFGLDAWTSFQSQENRTMRRGLRQSDRPTGRGKRDTLKALQRDHGRRCRDTDFPPQGALVQVPSVQFCHENCAAKPVRANPEKGTKRTLHRNFPKTLSNCRESRQTFKSCRGHQLISLAYHWLAEGRWLPRFQTWLRLPLGTLRSWSGRLDRRTRLNGLSLSGQTSVTAIRRVKSTILPGLLRSLIYFPVRRLG